MSIHPGSPRLYQETITVPGKGQVFTYVLAHTGHIENGMMPIVQCAEQNAEHEVMLVHCSRAANTVIARLRRVNWAQMPLRWQSAFLQDMLYAETDYPWFITAPTLWAGLLGPRGHCEALISAFADRAQGKGQYLDGAWRNRIRPMPWAHAVMLTFPTPELLDAAAHRWVRLLCEGANR